MREPRNRVVQVRRFGDPDGLAVVDAPLPTAGRGEVRVRVLASSVEYTDVTIRRHLYPWVLRRPPFVIGYDVVGEIDQLGDGVSGLQLGDRVADMTVLGSNAAYRTLRADCVTRVPADVDAAEAATLILSWTTAYQLLHRSRYRHPSQAAFVSYSIARRCRVLGTKRKSCARQSTTGFEPRFRHRSLRDGTPGPCDGTPKPRKCVLGTTLPNVPIRFAKTSRDRRRTIIQDAPREFSGALVGGLGRNKSQSIATPCLEATALGCRRLRRIDVFGRADLAGAGLGASIRNAAGSHGHRAATCAAAASTRRAHTAPAGPLAVRGACPPRACRHRACPRARRHYAVPLSVRGSDACDRPWHRPRQSGGHGADAPRRGLFA